MTAREVFTQSNGDVTRAFYAELDKRGAIGKAATCLFRAQKTSSRAKLYRGRRYKGAAYDTKSWSLGELCKLLDTAGPSLGFRWGWKEDPTVPFGNEPSWVLFVELPFVGQPHLPGAAGQVSFHSPTRGEGPVYEGEWDRAHASEERILALADAVMALPVGEGVAPAPVESPTHQQIAAVAAPLPVNPLARPLQFGDPHQIAAVRQLKKVRRAR